MKIVLIEPPIATDTITSFKYPPLGLVALGSYLEDKNNSVRIIDSVIDNLSIEKIIDKVSLISPDIIGISSMSVNINSTFRLSKRLKDIFPNIKIVAGGIHPTVMPDHTMTCKGIDYCVIGEGENTFQELVEGRNNKGILGLVYRDNGKVVINKKRPLISNLDSLPYLDYSLIDIHKYKSPYGRRTPSISMVRSRGCPYQCTFCGNSKMFGRTFRVQSPERTLDEILANKRLFGIKEISFKDTELTLDRNLGKLCDLMINKNINISWCCNGRVNNADIGLLRKMKKAGCYSITYGIESGNEEVLRIMKKSITLKQAKEAINNSRKAGLQIVTNFMLGNIGDNRETIRQTIDFSKKIDCDYVSFSIATPFPGTEMRDIAEKKGWLLDNSMDKVRYDECIMNATDMPTEELKSCLKQAFREFYFRPSYLIKRFLRSNVYDFKNYLWGFKEILG